MKRLLSLFAIASLLALPLAQAAPVHLPDPAGVHLALEMPPPAMATIAAPVLHAQPVLAALDLSNLFSGANVAWAVGALLSLLAGITGVSKWLTASRRKLIGFVAHHAFLIVEDADSNGLLDVSDKAMAGLKAADDWLAANGFRELSAKEQAAVKLAFKAQNGATVVAAKLAPVALVPQKPAAA